MRQRYFGWRGALSVGLGVVGVGIARHVAADPVTPPPNLIQLRTQYGLTPEAEKMLLQNGFLVLDQARYKTLGDAYPRQFHTTPMYVTTDAMLELWSSLNRELLKSTERQVCIKQLSTLLPALELHATKLYASAHDAQERKALRETLVTVAVASRLLNAAAPTRSLPPEVRSEIDSLVNKVMAHQEVGFYPAEDYTQYTVRGYYAEDTALSRYFRASMWLSRRFFAVTPQPGGDPDASLRAAIACAAVARSAGAEADRALNSLLRLRSALVGPSDTISLSQLNTALHRSVGADWDLSRALKPQALAALRRELAKPNYPVSLLRTRPVNRLGNPFPRQTVALLPGMVVPDSLLFQQTVHPAIRDLPTGLEVAAGLGSEAARREIEQVEGARAKEVLAAVDRAGAALRADDGATIYSGWLHALSTLAVTPKGAPEFMRNSAWGVEKLNTTLASWAQLRHHFILYAGQSYVESAGLKEAVPALVEPNPAFYHAMAQLAARTGSILQAAGGSDPKPAQALDSYAAKCREFEVYAHAELTGTLTPQQSQEIDKFCDWLDSSYTASAAAMVADVATGAETERGAAVLHAATGDLRTLLVIPNPKTGVVYTGAVLSYYEFPRTGSERLTDAQWQAQQSQSYLRPESPSWAYAFMARESGSDWQAHAPLRAAEKLFVANRPEEALALLRATVERDRQNPVATEAQWRVGRYYFDRKEFVQAQRELQLCERLPGCVAFDKAQELLQQLHAEQEHRVYLRNVVEPMQAKAREELKRLRSAVESWKRTPSDAAQERLLAQRLLRELPWTESDDLWQPEIKTLLAAAQSAFRTQPCRDAIGYVRLVVEQGGRYHEGGRADVDRALAFAHQTASPPLRAAALCLALQNGYLAKQPQAAIALLRPFLDLKSLNKADPALQLVQTPSDPKLLSELFAARPGLVDPIDWVQEQIGKTLLTAASNAEATGQIREAVRYARLYPFGPRGATRNEEYSLAFIIDTWAAIPEADVPAASMLAIVHRLEFDKQIAAAEKQCLTMAQRYPHSRYTLEALFNTIRNSRKDRPRGQESPLQAVLLQNYPETLQALCIEIEDALVRKDLPQARRLLAQYHSRVKDKAKDPSLQTEDSLQQVVSGVEWAESWLESYDKRVAQLKPLLDAAQDPESERMDRILSDGGPLAERLILRMPERATEIYETLGRIYQNPTLTMRFLERSPADPRAGEAWARLLGNERQVTPGALYSGEPETAVWLAPFIDRNDANAPTAALLLKRTINSGSGETGLRLAAEEARMVAARYPKSRASGVAELALAQLLFTLRRPEAMLPHVDLALTLLPENNPLHQEAVQARQRALQEIAAKRR